MLVESGSLRRLRSVSISSLSSSAWGTRGGMRPRPAPCARTPRPSRLPSATTDLHVLDHDGVGDAVGLQVGFEGLQAGEGHADVDRVPEAVGFQPEIQLEGEKVR